MKKILCLLSIFSYPYVMLAVFNRTLERDYKKHLMVY
jgi:hypothetical protein